MAMTKKKILDIVKEKNINFFRMQFVDVNGFQKNVAIPRSQLEKALDGRIMFDGSSIVGYATIDESDMVARPDLNTFLIMPWAKGDLKTSRVMCDVYFTSGERFKSSPAGTGFI